MKISRLLLFTVILMIMIPTGFILAQSTGTYAGQIVPTPTPFLLPTPLPEINTYEQTAQFSFADLNEETFTMRHPSFKDVYMPLPNEWNLVGGEGYSYIELHYDFFETDQDQTLNPTPHPLFEQYPFIVRPGIEIYINNILVHMFIPEIGKNNTVKIPIPSESIIPSGSNPYNEYIIRIGFYNDADIYCNYDGVLTIYNDSFVHTVFGQEPPYRLLSSLPRPLVSDSFLPETLKLIIPDTPSTSDLQALAIITSSIARNAFSNVSYDVIRASEVKPADTEASNIIVIGTPADNSYLKDLYTKQLLPSGLSTNGVDILQSGANTINENDGVLQIIPSADNQYYSVVTITGESGVGVVRAARAFEKLPIGTPSFLLVVTDEMTSTETEASQSSAGILQTKYTYGDLGYVDRTRFGLGLQRFFLFFYVPRDWVIEKDLELTINYAHSDAIEARSSNAQVNLNGEPIGNLILQESPTGEQTVIVPIRKEKVLKGSVNVVEFRANLSATLICEDYNPDVYWFKVSSDSTIEIPHRVTTSSVEIAPVINPIVPFAFETKHLVILGNNPSQQQLNIFANLYAELGELNGMGEFDVIVSMDQSINLDDYPDRNIIMIGLPSSSDLVSQVNDQLPQPFTPGTDNLQQNIANSAYQLVPGTSIGVAQAIPAKWDYARTITLLTGTSPEGIDWISERLLDNPSGFLGDLFFAQDTTVTSFMSYLFSQPVLDTMVSETIQDQALVPVEEDPTDVSGMDVLGGEFIRDEKVNESTTPMFLMGVIGIVGLIFIIYLASRIASGGRKS